MAAPNIARFQLKRDTTANWLASTVKLQSGELGYDFTKKELRVGNGNQLWKDLPTIGSGSGGISSTIAINSSTISGSVVNLNISYSGPNISAATVKVYVKEAGLYTTEVVTIPSVVITSTTSEIPIPINNLSYNNFYKFEILDGATKLGELVDYNFLPAITFTITPSVSSHQGIGVTYAYTGPNIKFDIFVKQGSATIAEKLNNTLTGNGSGTLYVTKGSDYSTGAYDITVVCEGTTIATSTNFAYTLPTLTAALSDSNNRQIDLTFSSAFPSAILTCAGNSINVGVSVPASLILANFPVAGTTLTLTCRFTGDTNVITISLPYNRSATLHSVSFVNLTTIRPSISFKGVTSVIFTLGGCTQTIPIADCTSSIVGSDTVYTYNSAITLTSTYGQSRTGKLTFGGQDTASTTHVCQGSFSPPTIGIPFFTGNTNVSISNVNWTGVQLTGLPVELRSGSSSVNTANTFDTSSSTISIDHTLIPGSTYFIRVILPDLTYIDSSTSTLQPIMTFSSRNAASISFQWLSYTHAKYSISSCDSLGTIISEVKPEVTISKPPGAITAALPSLTNFIYNEYYLVTYRFSTSSGGTYTSPVNSFPLKYEFSLSLASAGTTITDVYTQSTGLVTTNITFTAPSVATDNRLKIYLYNTDSPSSKQTNFIADVTTIGSTPLSALDAGPNEYYYIACVMPDVSGAYNIIIVTSSNVLYNPSRGTITVSNFGNSPNPVATFTRTGPLTNVSFSVLNGDTFANLYTSGVISSPSSPYQFSGYTLPIQPSLPAASLIPYRFSMNLLTGGGGISRRVFWPLLTSEPVVYDYDNVPSVSNITGRTNIENNNGRMLKYQIKWKGFATTGILQLFNAASPATPIETVDSNIVLDNYRTASNQYPEVQVSSLTSALTNGNYYLRLYLGSTSGPFIQSDQFSYTATTCTIAVTEATALTIRATFTWGGNPVSNRSIRLVSSASSNQDTLSSATVGSTTNSAEFELTTPAFFTTSGNGTQFFLSLPLPHGTTPTSNVFAYAPLTYSSATMVFRNTPGGGEQGVLYITATVGGPADRTITYTLTEFDSFSGGSGTTIQTTGAIATGTSHTYTFSSSNFSFGKWYNVSHVLSSVFSNSTTPSANVLSTRLQYLPKGYDILVFSGQSNMGGRDNSAWEAGKFYPVGTIVYYAAALYISISSATASFNQAPTINNPPVVNDEYWALFTGTSPKVWSTAERNIGITYRSGVNAKKVVTSTDATPVISLTNATAPFTGREDAKRTSANGGVTLAYDFSNFYATKLLEESNRDLIIVYEIRGGTGIAEATHGWIGTVRNTYDALVNATEFAGRQTVTLTGGEYSRNRISAFLWHQGEADRTNDNYIANHITLLNNFTNESALTALKLFKGPLNVIVGNIDVTHNCKLPDSGFTNIISLLDNYDSLNTSPNFRVKSVSSFGLRCIDQDANYDNLGLQASVHFNARSERLFGRRYFNAYLDLIGVTIGALEASEVFPPSVTTNGVISYDSYDVQNNSFSSIGRFSLNSSANSYIYSRNVIGYLVTASLPLTSIYSIFTEYNTTNGQAAATEKTCYLPYFVKTNNEYAMVDGTTVTSGIKIGGSPYAFTPYILDSSYDDPSRIYQQTLTGNIGDFIREKIEPYLRTTYTGGSVSSRVTTKLTLSINGIVVNTNSNRYVITGGNVVSGRNVYLFLSGTWPNILVGDVISTKSVTSPSDIVNGIVTDVLPANNRITVSTDLVNGAGATTIASVSNGTAIIYRATYTLTPAEFLPPYIGLRLNETDLPIPTAPFPGEYPLSNWDSVTSARPVSVRIGGSGTGSILVAGLVDTSTALTSTSDYRPGGAGGTLPSPNPSSWRLLGAPSDMWNTSVTLNPLVFPNRSAWTIQDGNDNGFVVSRIAKDTEWYLFFSQGKLSTTSRTPPGGGIPGRSRSGMSDDLNHAGGDQFYATQQAGITFDASTMYVASLKDVIKSSYDPPVFYFYNTGTGFTCRLKNVIPNKIYKITYYISARNNRVPHNDTMLTPLGVGAVDNADFYLSNPLPVRVYTATPTSNNYLEFIGDTTVIGQDVHFGVGTNTPAESQVATQPVQTHLHTSSSSPWSGAWKLSEFRFRMPNVLDPGFANYAYLQFGPLPTTRLGFSKLTNVQTITGIQIGGSTISLRVANPNLYAVGDRITTSGLALYSSTGSTANLTNVTVSIIYGTGVGIDIEQETVRIESIVMFPAIFDRATPTQLLNVTNIATSGGTTTLTVNNTLSVGDFIYSLGITPAICYARVTARTATTVQIASNVSYTRVLPTVGKVVVPDIRQNEYLNSGIAIGGISCTIDNT